MKICAIVPAAGRGARLMKGRSQIIPNKTKPFLLVGGIPIITRSLETLSRVSAIKEIFVVLSPSAKPFFDNLLKKQPGLRKKIKTVSGGKTRAQSVNNAFRRLSLSYTHVLIHDAARPFVRKEAITRLIENIGDSDGAILAKPVTPTIKRVNNRGEILETLDRNTLWEAETPQLFKISVLSRAYKLFASRGFSVTDEASLIEIMGGSVKVVEDPYLNLKITTPSDLDLARRYVLIEGETTRFGIGFDIHRLVKGRPLYLGGVKIKAPFGAQGHSDADCLLHAICDGMLGALSLGDIGEHFPDTDPKYKGIRSTKILENVISKVDDASFCVSNIDCNIILEKPKLGPYKKSIRKKLSKLMNVKDSCIGIKAKTSEGVGMVGKGEAIVCHALVHLKRKEEG